MDWWMYIIAYCIIGVLTLFAVVVAEPDEFENANGDMVSIAFFLTVLWPIAWVVGLGVGIVKAGIALGKAIREMNK